METENAVLRDLGRGCYAYFQRDGSWGWSNSGLVVDGGHALMVDTLFDLRLTRELLEAYDRVLPTGAAIETLVNTHANGDHTFGNQLVRGARIVATRSAAEEMTQVPPAALAALMRAAPGAGLAGEFLQRIFGPFDFEGIALVPPHETFTGETTLHVGGKEVRLIEVGPAHTRGDALVHVPGDRLLYAADILFIGGHPIMWEGPLDNWLRALDLILGLDLETIVPGHGPPTGRAGVARVRDYLVHLDREARPRYEAGLSPMEAALDIPLDDYADWGEAERVVVNVETLFRGYSGGERRGAAELFTAMAEFERRRGGAALSPG